jgi:hypothetical protein
MFTNSILILDIKIMLLVSRIGVMIVVEGVVPFHLALL